MFLASLRRPVFLGISASMHVEEGSGYMFMIFQASRALTLVKLPANHSTESYSTYSNILNTRLTPPTFRAISTAIAA